MKITVNGKVENLKEDTLLIDFITNKSLDPKKIIIQLDNQIINKEKFNTLSIKDNSKIEVLAVFGGGWYER